MHEGGAAFVHHLGLPLRVEILGDDANDPQDLPLPGLQNQAVFLKEIEQVLLGQVERLLSLQKLTFGLAWILALLARAGGFATGR